MGLFLHTAIVQRNDIENEKIKAGIQKSANEHSDMSIIAEKCKIVNSDKGVLIIFNEEANVDEELAKAFSKEICSPIMFLFIYDGDGWGYVYCDDGVIKDLFFVSPEAEENPSPDEYGNSAKFIAERFNINPDTIIRYYKIWTDELIEDEVVAYDDDEFVYGDCWQMADFMKRLGIIFPYGGNSSEKSKAVSTEAAKRAACEHNQVYQYVSLSPCLCAFDYTHIKNLLKIYQSSLGDVIESEALGEYRQARDKMTKKIDALKGNCNSDEERKFLSDMYLLRGSFSLRIGNSWQSGRDLDAAYELEPENVYILRQRTQMGTSKDRIKRAINDLNTLMRIDEQNYDYYLVERAWRSYRIEEIEAAKNDLLEAKNRGKSANNDDFVALCKKLGVAWQD